MKHRAFLLLGSNQQSPLLQLHLARNHLEKHFRILKYSSILETIAYGNINQPNFWNQVLWIETEFDPFQLLSIINSIEKMMGRIRQERWEPRIIDIDLIFYDSLILDTETLVIPHYDAANRWFIIHLIKEIAPETIHPVLKKTIQALYQEKNFFSNYLYNQTNKYNTRY